MTISSFMRRAGRRRRAGWAGVLALPALLGAAGSCSAASYVVQNKAGSGAGSLRDALLSAQADGDSSDTITFASGVTGTIALGGAEIAIGKSVSISGPGAKSLALDAGGNSRVFNISAGTVSLSGLTIKNGSADNGGGITNAATLAVTACAFSGDSAASEGGGLYNDSGTATITGSTFSGDSATHGGGLFNSNGTVSVTNSTFSGDTASADGSAVVNFSTLAITSSTVSGNSNTSGGGQGAVANYSTLTVTATLFSGNTGGDFGSFGFFMGGQGGVTSGGSNLLGDASPGPFGTPGDHDQFGVTDAMLGPLQDNGGPTFTCAALSGSPAVGGDSSGATSADQRGTARTAEQHTVGAFEYTAPLVPVVRTHVLWNNSDGRVMLWNLDAQGGVTSHTFGPYADPTPQDKWTATALATGPDGKSHIVWNNTNGRVALWTIDDSGGFTLAGFGPYTDDSVGADPSLNKWSAKAVSVGPDNVTHLLWDNTDHRMMLWSVDSAFSLLDYAGFGPYGDNAPASDPSRLWDATALATGPDNISHVLWNDADGRVALWNMDSAFGFTGAGFGPYTDAGGAWSATAVSAGPDNVTHLLWGSTNHGMRLWNVDGAFDLLGSADFGPYADDAPLSDPSRLWTATALATGADNVSHVLWNDADGRVALWDMNSAFGFTLAGFGPFSDSPGAGAPVGAWTATAVSAPPGTPER